MSLRSSATLRAADHVERARLVDVGLHTRAAFLAVVAAVTLVCVAAYEVGGVWAFLPVIGAIMVIVGERRLVLSRRPEVWDFAIGVTASVTVALAAAKTGGLSSPLTLFLPLGILIGAVRSPALTHRIGFVVLLVTFCGAVALEPGRFGLLPFGALVAAMVATFTVSSSFARIERASRRASSIDPLTGLLNRSSLEGRFAELAEQAALNGAPIGAVLFDIDHFKRVNDEHGHEAGDAVLRGVAYEIRTSLRRFELAYRLGGEEFLILLPGLTDSEASAVAEGVRERIEAVAVAGVRVTASFGVADSSVAGVDLERLTRHADAAMYRAKTEGRNRICSSPEPVPTG